MTSLYPVDLRTSQDGGGGGIGGGGCDGGGGKEGGGGIGGGGGQRNDTEKLLIMLYLSSFIERLIRTEDVYLQQLKLTFCTINVIEPFI